MNFKETVSIHNRRDNIHIKTKNNKKDIKNVLPKSNVLLRTIFTIVMISIILCSLYLDKLYLFVMVYIIKSFIYKELIRMVKFPAKRGFFSSKYLVWYFKAVADLYFIGKNVMKIYPTFIPDYIANNHLFICFTLYITGIVLFVVNLEKKLMRIQFGRFALSHLTIYMVNIAMVLFMNNIINGKVWFIFPIVLVAANDIFAYITGKIFGKTPLIKLSPKKTIEGFLGGFLFTTIVGLGLCYIKTKYSICTNNYDALLMSTKKIVIGYNILEIKRIYIHGSSFILFASFIAPFGGFFASGLKRAFKIKDFGESIPGHGGFADRMDCQILMGMFTNVYFRTFIMQKLLSLEKIYDIAIKNLNSNEINQLVSLLQCRQSSL